MLAVQNVQSSIVEHLCQVALERQRRGASPELRAAVQAVKLYQQKRFRHTYADLLSTERYGAASRFFLEELYGPRDFTRRDAQFERVVPALVRVFPLELVRTVETLAKLHAVSESLDSAMGALLTDVFELDACSYIGAWQVTGRADCREAQISLTLEVGAALDLYTRKPLLRHTLRMMRGPARAAGLGELQHFLETGFDAFKAMTGATEFLQCVAQRERHLASSLFVAELRHDVELEKHIVASARTALDQLP